MRMMELKPSGGVVADRGRLALRRGNPAGPSGVWRGAGVSIITAAPRGQVAMRQVRVRGRIRAAAGLLGRRSSPRSPTSIRGISLLTLPAAPSTDMNWSGSS
jgi:hypothetical protein